MKTIKMIENKKGQLQPNFQGAVDTKDKAQQLSIFIKRPIIYNGEYLSSDYRILK